jgi:signal transduction histidine kinase
MEVQGNRMQGMSDGYRFDESTLLGTIANELDSPLALLRQLSMALASNDLSETERQRLTQQLTLISERALRLTRQLAFDPASVTLMDLEPVNAVTLCQEVVYELSPLFQAHGRSITMQPRSKVPLLIANRKLLRQLLVSLGDNALHYGSDDKPIRLSIHAKAGNVRIGIRDYGPAVPADIWQRLDGRVARRAAAPLPRRPQVSGLGLTTSRKIAELMGGVVDVTRHRDGATFYVAMRTSGQMSLL